LTQGALATEHTEVTHDLAFVNFSLSIKVITKNIGSIKWSANKEIAFVN
jgi:hypothetical protein